MTMKRIVICSLIIVGVLAIGGFGLIKVAAKHLRLEDEVPHTFNRVLTAIMDYEETNGVSPQSLTALVPAFLPSLPTSAMVRAVSYTVSADRANWLFTVEASVHGDDWMYCRRTDASLAWPGGWTNIGVIHGWDVLKREH